MKNCGRETQNVPVKKIATIAKNVFHGHFSLSREKKNRLTFLVLDFSICLPRTNRGPNLNDFEGEDKDNKYLFCGFLFNFRIGRYKDFYPFLSQTCSLILLKL